MVIRGKVLGQVNCNPKSVQDYLKSVYRYTMIEMENVCMIRNGKFVSHVVFREFQAGF